METQTYSRRLLSPFHGVQQIIAVKGGVAESMDGWDWKLYVADESIISHTGLSEIVYGSWNSTRGLSRSRIRGTMPSGLIEEIGDRLLTMVERHAGKIPFPAADHCEYWLLDERKGYPLALLESALDNDTLCENDRPAWYPGGQATKRFFSNSGDAEDLTQLIRDTAGKQSTAIWIKRSADGTGSGQHGEHFPVAAFPPLLLRDQWIDADHKQLVMDFLSWQAPWLLQLSLESEVRKQLEHAAWKRPQESSRVFRLFPEILDQKGLTTTRVKARMLQEKPDLQQVNEPFYPFVNE
ncbi:MAG: hypothetical protein KZQ90_01730 [Candidatus Thiodiazotropha sp. (ex Codakia rugifera)]|nr:hypothetical protein [Candidatus Thiodiazotropha sp. (ex Codakia rugifera)]